MRRCFVGLVFFSIAFFVGHIGAELALQNKRDDQVNSATILRLTELPDSLTQKDSTSLVRDLPNFDQTEGVEFTTKLIDVKEYAGSAAATDYRKSEIIAKNGEKWLGLFSEKGGFLVKEVTVGVDLHHRATDPDYDDWYYFRSGWKKPPIFIVKDSTALRSSPVTSLFHKDYPEPVDDEEVNAHNLRIGFDQKFSLFENEYSLRVVPGNTLDGTKVNVLLLESSGSRQVVTYNLYHQDSTTLYDSIGELLFVGDLDGDRKLDFYLSDFGFEKGGFGSQLFLSSEAEPGKLIKLVATFSTSGC